MFDNENYNYYLDDLNEEPRYIGRYDLSKIPVYTHAFSLWSQLFDNLPYIKKFLDKNGTVFNNSKILKYLGLKHSDIKGENITTVVNILI